MLGGEEIQKIIPHRPPFLLLDEIDELEPGVRAVGRWRLTGAEDFFRGHFPGQPVLPGVLIIESMAQTGGVVMLSLPCYAGKLAYFAGIDKVRFRRKVFPGDCLETDVRIERVFQNIGYGKATASVNGEKAASGTLKFSIG
ncbi:MAG: 3-hydroxyacyl-ACP dehydratase FabZ [Oscillospiraceae bacterium]|jgi:3-hydroxyacyl-[acyl-carrier-protein] dehydratase|nr:3-hydroxyacyl-ACP dehydratase FabZ [Oscillospiraceae bacterium]